MGLKPWAPRFNVHLAKIDASLPLLEKRFLEAWNMWQTLGVNGLCSDWKLDFCWDARCKKWPRSFGSMGLCVLWNAWRICSSQFYPDSATFSWIPAMRPMTTSNQILISGTLTLCRGSKSALTVIPARLVDLVDFHREDSEFSLLSLWEFLLVAMLPGLQWPGFCKESAHCTGQESSQLLVLP